MIQIKFYILGEDIIIDDLPTINHRKTLIVDI